MRLIPWLPMWANGFWVGAALAVLAFCVAAVLTSCSPMTCQTRLQVRQVGQDVTVKCRGEWDRSYRCTTAGIVVRGGESRLMCDGSTLAIMPGEVTEVAP